MEQPSSGEPGAPRPAEPHRLGELSRGEWRILLAIVLGGALLRCAHHWGRALSGDEVGTLRYLNEDYGVLLTEFRTWLTMNFYQAALKGIADLFGSSPWVLVLPSLLPGIALVPLVAAITLRVSTVRHALLAAAFTAYNPFLVLYSTQVRSYMLFLALSALTLLWLLDWQRAPRWRTGWRVGLANAATFIAHPNGIYPASGLAALLVRLRRLDLLRNWNRAELGRLVTLLAPGGIALGAVLLAYLPLLDDMSAVDWAWHDTPPTNLVYLPELCQQYFGGGYGSLATLLLIGAGLWRAAEENRALLDLSLLVVLPIVLVSLLGVSVYPWTYARYLISILPILMVWMAFACLHPGRRVLSFVLACTPLVAWTPGLARLFEEKRNYPWNVLAESLTAELDEYDRILCMETSIKRQLWTHEMAYEGRFVTAEELVELGPPASGPLRLRVLTDEPHLDGPESRTFGRIQELDYRGANGAEVALALARDIDEQTGGRIESRLTNSYEQAYEIYESLGRRAAYSVHIKLLKCQSLLYREKLRPVQLP